MKHFMGLLYLISVTSLFAHLEEGSLRPEGGETFVVGETMTIQWTANIAHDGRYDIYFSKDGGSTYPLEMAGPWQGSREDGATNTYLWEIPEDAVTTQGRIRICQLAGGHCVDPGTYMLDSPENFSIEVPSSLKEGESGKSAFGFTLVSSGSSIDVSFKLESENSVKVQAYDVNGNLLATLADGKLSEGNHQLSYQTELSAPNTAVVVKLEINGVLAASKVWASSK